MQDIAQEMMQFARDEGADDAVVHLVDVRKTQIRFSQSLVDISKRWRERTAEVFLAVDGKVTWGLVGDLDAWKDEVRELLAGVRASQPNPTYAGLAEGPFTYAHAAPDPALRRVDAPESLVKRTVQAAQAAGAEECAGTLYTSWDERSFASSAGPAGADTSAWIHLSIRAFREPGGSGHDVQAATRLAELDPEAVGRRAGEFASLAVSPKQGKAGTYDVVLGPMIFGSLVSDYARRTSAYMVEAGLSFFQDKVGEPVASPAFTLVDDATLDTKGRQAFDEEGVATRPTEIVAEGELQTYLHSTSTAAAHGVETTGNAHRLESLGNVGFINPAPFALSIAPGDYALEEMLEDLGSGLYLTNTWYHRYRSYMDGEFSTLPRDAMYVVEDGAITGAVKELRLSDNMIRLFRSIEGLTKERRQVEWWLEILFPTLAPSAMVRDVPLTASRL